MLAVGDEALDADPRILPPRVLGVALELEELGKSLVEPDRDLLLPATIGTRIGLSGGTFHHRNSNGDPEKCPRIPDPVPPQGPMEI